MLNEKHNGNHRFGSKIGFILSAAGSAVGLGNLWSFPYKAGVYGGAAFVLVTLIMVIILGLVVMLVEMYIGRHGRGDVVSSYAKISPKLKWVGYLALLVPFIISCYYIVIGGWSVKYAMSYLVAPDFINTAGDSNGAFTSFISSPYSPIIFTGIFLAISLVIVCGGIQKGIEKASKILMPTLLLLLIITVIRSLTLPNSEGVMQGLEFFILKFDFKALGWAGVVAAMGQAFFSLSLGMGAMIVYGSYSGKSTPLGKSAAMVCVFDTLVALLAGLAIFPAVFAYGLEPSSGPGLLFATMPNVFSSMPGGALFGFLFFALISVAAVTSVISLIEVATGYLIAKLKWSRKKAALLFGGMMMVIAVFISLSQGAIPSINFFQMDLLTFLDELTNTIMMPINAIIACIILGYVVKPKNAIIELRQTEKLKLGVMWGMLAKYVAPILIGIVLIFGVSAKVKSIGDGFYFVIGLAVFLVLVTVAVNIIGHRKDKKNTPIEPPLV